MIERLADQLSLIGGSYLVWNLNSLCGFAIPESEVYATLRGFLLAQLQCRPRVGDVVEHGHWRYAILAGRAALI